jgi:hypothetical protein
MAAMLLLHAVHRQIQEDLIRSDAAVRQLQLWENSLVESFRGTAVKLRRKLRLGFYQLN